MTRRLSIAGLLLAWLCASGALLDAVQVFAWARMFAGYVQTAPAAVAMAETFDAGKPCPLCRAVGMAREAAHHQPESAATAFGKLILVRQEAEAFVASPSSEEWPESARESAPARCRPVPVPPPRGLSA